jgi:hypothetical protein
MMTRTVLCEYQCCLMNHRLVHLHAVCGTRHLAVFETMYCSQPISPLPVLGKMGNSLVRWVKWMVCAAVAVAVSYYCQKGVDQ